MDGLDIYIDDYTQADPMPAGMLDKLANVYAMLTEGRATVRAQPASAEERPRASGRRPIARAIEAAPQPLTCRRAAPPRRSRRIRTKLAE